MKVVVITGGTKGIGFALADSFLAAGCSVVLCGRTETSAAGAAAALGKKHGGERAAGFACDVRDPKQLERLWERAASKFGHVDIWVNNAGLAAAQMQTWQIPEREIAAVLDTNLAGVIYGSQVAIRGMLAQGHGAIYNMEGAGSDGRMHRGLLSYGATKYAVSYFTRGLAQELKGTPLIVGSLRPGMIITELVTAQFEGRPEEWKRAKRIFNIIANRPEEIAPKLAKRMLENMRSGVCISYLSSWGLTWRFMTAPLRRRDLFAADASA
jgi:NAD(P)-dependent dehydrogenase (short-subunit alcohol dehydrogenase family)